MQQYNSPLARNLRRLCEAQENLSQKKKGKTAITEELAKHCGVSVQSVYAWKNGRSVPQPGKVRKIAEYFHVTEERLYREEHSQDDILIAERAERPLLDDASVWEAFSQAVNVSSQLAPLVIIARLKFSEPHLFSLIVNKTLDAVSLADHSAEQMTISTDGKTVNATANGKTLSKYTIHSLCAQLEQALNEIVESMAIHAAPYEPDGSLTAEDFLLPDDKEDH